MKNAILLLSIFLLFSCRKEEIDDQHSRDYLANYKNWKEKPQKFSCDTVMEKELYVKFKVNGESFCLYDGYHENNIVTKRLEWFFVPNGSTTTIGNGGASGWANNRITFSKFLKDSFHVANFFLELPIVSADSNYYEYGVLPFMKEGPVNINYNKGLPFSSAFPSDWKIGIVVPGGESRRFRLIPYRKDEKEYFTISDVYYTNEFGLKVVYFSLKFQFPLYLGYEKPNFSEYYGELTEGEARLRMVVE
jgi:hypothetical protein